MYHIRNVFGQCFSYEMLCSHHTQNRSFEELYNCFVLNIILLSFDSICTYLHVSDSHKIIHHLCMLINLLKKKKILLLAKLNLANVSCAERRGIYLGVLAILICPLLLFFSCLTP